jgi:hypothetical protein
MNIADDAAIGNVDFRAVGGGRERLMIDDWRLGYPLFLTPDC